MERILECYEDRISIFQYNPSFGVVESYANLEDIDLPPTDFRLAGLPQRTMIDSLMLESPRGVSLLRRTYSKREHDKDRFYGSSVEDSDGRKIGVLDIFHDGRVISVIDGSGKIVFRDPRNIKLTLPKDEMVVRISGKKVKEERLKFLYLTEGLDWDFAYNASIGEDKFDLSGEYVIRNDSGKTFRDIEVALVKGKVVVSRDGRYYEEVSRGEYGAEVDSLLQEFMDFDVGLKEEELRVVREHMPNFQRRINPTLDLLIDSLPERHTLEDGKVLTIPILPFREIPFKKEFVYDPLKFGDSVAITLSFENTRNNNLGMRLLPGGIGFYIKSGREGYAKTTLDYVYPGEIGSIKVGSLSTIEVRKSDEREGKEFHLKNYSNEDKEVVIVEHLRRGSKIKDIEINQKGVIIEVGKREARLPVTVPASGEATLGYVISRPGLLGKIFRR